MAERRDEWGNLPPLYVGEAFAELHPGEGTRWVKDPQRGYWPDCCDKHRPREIIEKRRG